MIAAVIFPHRANAIDAIAEAMESRHAPDAQLYTNGDRLAWLVRPIPGWMKFGATLKPHTTPPEAA